MSEGKGGERKWFKMDSAPKDGTVIELRCANGEIKKARWGKWEYRNHTDVWWCSPDAGWTFSRSYAPDAWRYPSTDSNEDGR